MTPTTRGVADDPKVADTKSRRSEKLIKKTTDDLSKKSSTSKDSKMTKFSKALPPIDITKLESLSNPNKDRLTVNEQIKNLLISMNLCSIKIMIQVSNLDLNDVIAFFHAKIYETLIFKRQS